MKWINRLVWSLVIIVFLYFLGWFMVKFFGLTLMLLVYLLSDISTLILIGMLLVGVTIGIVFSRAFLETVINNLPDEKDSH